MVIYYLSFGIAVVSLASYHLIQKVTPGGIHPSVSLFITYLVSLVACLVAFFFFPIKNDFFTELKSANWTSYALGLAIFGAEIGFLLAYRSGWKISIASTLSNVFVALLLLPIGLFFFKEKLTLINMAGIIFSILGMVLIFYK